MNLSIIDMLYLHAYDSKMLNVLSVVQSNRIIFKFPNQANN